MDYLLIEGTANVGKTTIVKCLANRFLAEENGWKKVVGDNVPSLSSKEDFIALYEKKGKRVVLNSGSDDIYKLETCKEFCNKNQPVDLLITSLREDKYEECNTWKKIFKFLGIEDNDKRIEFPLAKITRHNDPETKKESVKWYREKGCEILRLLLKDELGIDLK